MAILGSTGSIGQNALEVIEHLPDRLVAAALSGRNNVELLIEQCARYRPAAVAVTDEAGAARLRRCVDAQVYVGTQGLCELVARDDIDIVLAAIVGAAGLPAVLSAIRAGKRIALANKESLVIAGSLLIPEARRRGVKLIPVDSEHSAVFQAMSCGRLGEVHRVILTASGGPFRTWPVDRIRNARPEEALNHPIWRMGNKITIDSATMFNKALELIEAVWLFDLPPEKIEVVVHPESVVHSMVEFVDCNIIAQLSPPDMKTPIQYALTHPDRLGGAGRRMDWTTARSLNFEPPDPQRFPALRLGYECARRRGTCGAVLNAANEAAVQAFTAGKIPFGQIAELVEAALDKHPFQAEPAMDDLLEADRWARNHVNDLVR